MNKLLTVATIFIALFAQNVNALNCMGTWQQKCQCIAIGAGGFVLPDHTGDCSNIPQHTFFDPNNANTKCSGHTIECNPCPPDANGVVPTYCLVNPPISAQIPSATALTTNANGENCGGTSSENACSINNMNGHSCVWTPHWATWQGGTNPVPAASCFNAPANAAPTPPPAPAASCDSAAQGIYKKNCCGQADPANINLSGFAAQGVADQTCAQLDAALTACTSCAV